MKISPALPYPPQPSVDRERETVAEVQPVARSRDALEQAGQRRPPDIIPDTSARERLGHTAAGPVRSAGQTSRAARALASYAEVADDHQRSALADMLGFDAYA